MAKKIKVELKSEELYKNKKTGQLYFLLDEVIDCTNDRKDLKIVYYVSCQPLVKFARESKEFYEKFEKVVGKCN